jgi:hypothetical protein
MEVVSLWRDFLKTSRTPSDTRKQRFVHDSQWSADISADLLEQIWERIYDTETYSHPLLPSTCPEWDVNCRASLTYPNEGKQQWRLTDLVWHQNGLPDGTDLVKKSAGDSQALIAPLGLPALPSPIFCYYVYCKWAWSLISKYRAGTGREMKPLMKAAVLKQIKLF